MTFSWFKVQNNNKDSERHIFKNVCDFLKCGSFFRVQIPFVEMLVNNGQQFKKGNMEAKALVAYDCQSCNCRKLYRE